MTKHVNLRKTRGIVAVRADATGDLTKLITSLNSDYEQFKATMEEKDKELAKKFDDVVTTEKLDRINSSVSDLQKLVDDANAKIAAVSMSAGGEKPLKDHEYSDAFTAHMKKGEIHADLNKGTDGEGGYVTPVEWDRTITDRLVQVSPMRSICASQSISGNGFSKLFNNRGTASGWVGETAARPETDTPTLSTYAYATGELYANPAATQQILDDAEINLEMWLAGEVETEFALQEGIAFLSGNGTNKPKGLLNFITGGTLAADHPWGAIGQVNSGSAAALTADGIVNLVYGLPSEYTANARFIMNRGTQEKTRLLKDGQGNYLWQPTFVAGQPASLAGYPLVEIAGMPDVAANANAIVFGDFQRGYLIIDRIGVRVLRDPFTNKPFVQFYTTKRVGGGLLNPDVMKAQKISA